MLINNKTIKAGAGVILMLGLGHVQAAMMNFNVTGDIIVGQETFSNIYNLSAGDTVNLSGWFDDAGLMAGTGTVYFDMSHSSNQFNVYLGSATVSHTADQFYQSGGYPTLTFNNYQLVDMDMLAANFSSFGLGFDDMAGMYGQWQADVQFSPVPVPAALWLFGSGLIGLVGVLKRK